MVPITNIALIAAALGSGLIAGIFFAFSTFIMQAFARLPAEQGIAAMQSINTTILRSPFMAVFLVTLALSVFIAVMAIVHWRGGVSILMLAGAALYIVTTFVSTIVFNVPLNDALDKVDGRTTEAATLWATYLGDWTKWNHLRTGASLLAACAFVRALF
ncbi:anthrone oxygenase family protein [Rhizobium sp. BK602]|uniref:anthrone oxygenase family protein n=1 Tax=Rhizobium sp. BK602 TaxID=2586986 RepID=UPI00161562BC|nr:anthrone oxygenase family protein [Rhizobium sp. BK602]MBB3608177.1 putative membrane protein [Rhizobium sp. BK602]